MQLSPRQHLKAFRGSCCWEQLLQVASPYSILPPPAARRTALGKKSGAASLPETLPWKAHSASMWGQSRDFWTKCDIVIFNMSFHYFVPLLLEPTQVFLIQNIRWRNCSFIQGVVLLCISVFALNFLSGFLFLPGAFFFIGNSHLSKKQNILQESFQLHFLKLEWSVRLF